jgi:hypothetical protein
MNVLLSETGPRFVAAAESFSLIRGKCIEETAQVWLCAVTGLALN